MKYRICLFVLLLVWTSAITFADELNQFPVITPDNAAEIHEIGIVGSSETVYGGVIFSPDGTGWPL